MSRRWIRLDAQWDESEWIAKLSGEAAGCWPRLLCWVKLRGRRGVCSRPNSLALSKAWGVGREAIEAMLSAALEDGAIRLEGEQLIVTQWVEYQEIDPTARDRKRKQRASVTEESRVTSCDPVARDHQPPTLNPQTETTAPASPAADVENQTGPADDGSKAKQEVPTGRVDERPAYTLGELLRLANERLGLGRLPYREQAANKRILNDWLYSSAKRDPVDIACAVEGAADMRDRDLIGWDSAKPGTPVTLKALNGPMTLADQGDGKAVRNLYDVASEYWRKLDGQRGRAPTPTAKLKGAPLRGIGDILGGHPETPRRTA